MEIKITSSKSLLYSIIYMTENRNSPPSYVLFKLIKIFNV